MSLLEKKIPIELTLAEAIVIANFITRQDNFNSGIASLTEVEKRALWNFECLPEKVLTEPLIENYEKTLAEAGKLLSGEDNEI